MVVMYAIVHGIVTHIRITSSNGQVFERFLFGFPLTPWKINFQLAYLSIYILYKTYLPAVFKLLIYSEIGICTYQCGGGCGGGTFSFNKTISLVGLSPFYTF